MFSDLLSHIFNIFFFMVHVFTREQDRCSITPSPTDDFLGHSSKGEIPAWKSANQELAGVLKNLRKIEHHLQGMIYFVT